MLLSALWCLEVWAIRSLKIRAHITLRDRFSSSGHKIWPCAMTDRLAWASLAAPIRDLWDEYQDYELGRFLIRAGSTVAYWLRNYATNRKVARSKPEILPAALGLGIYSAPNRNSYQKQKCNVSEEYGGRRAWLTTLPQSVSRMSRQCGVCNISQTYRLPRPVAGIALLFICRWCSCLARNITCRPPRPSPGVAFLYVDYVRTSQETRLWASTTCYGYSFTCYVHEVIVSIVWGLRVFCMIGVCVLQPRRSTGVGDGAIPLLGEELSAKHRRASGGEELLHCSMR
jgi:hypothetical protein